jgi:hypothetical protein
MQFEGFSCPDEVRQGSHAHLPHNVASMDLDSDITQPEFCRMHGAGGGAREGNRNAWRHGNYSAEAIETRRTITALMRQTRQLVETL